MVRMNSTRGVFDHVMRRLAGDFGPSLVAAISSEEPTLLPSPHTPISSRKATKTRAEVAGNQGEVFQEDGWILFCPVCQEGSSRNPLL